MLPDSMWVGVPGRDDFDVQEEGGLHLDEMVSRIQVGKMQVQGYRAVFLLIGTNNVLKVGRDLFMQRYGDLVDLIIRINPRARVVVTSILPRLCDERQESLEGNIKQASLHGDDYKCKSEAPGGYSRLCRVPASQS